MLHDKEWQYHLHLWSYSPRGLSGGDDRHKSSTFVDAVAAKWFFVSDFLSHRAAENASVLFTDIDVVPLGTFGTLADLLPPDRELTWMYNRLPHLPANSGFFLMRNTPNVRGFVRQQREILEEKGRGYYASEQILANILLSFNVPKGNKFPGPGESSKGTALRWGLFTIPHVSALPKAGEVVYNTTIVLHGIGVSNHTNKVHRLNWAVSRMRAGAPPGVHYWQRECPPHQQASCAEYDEEALANDLRSQPKVSEKTIALDTTKWEYHRVL